MNQATKTLIDNARDTLVGKVPNPLTQVEQITIALIYKFMDDMDCDSIDMGGKPNFFAGDYAKYSWRKMYSSSKSSEEILKTYTEALEELPKNTNLPTLFITIFNNAYLPYKDARTLKLFLGYIDQFTYDHSENLGDTFEYVLSVLGSQADAGQFRTPRHIIDFMVEIVKPTKTDTILDPACGTGGFLISSDKYIKRQNTTNNILNLSAKERITMAKNITGYDITPDMVRLSLVNMYLHSIENPQIYEYDTLSSTQRWEDYFDVILANPPFMSPKGGIIPHSKFSIQSTRSEVLFVDYMAEHLSSKGRAAIIVPEGIIFKNETAFRKLRKNLVDNNYLYGVISLPSGIFQPYSPVTTSILLLDRTLAKKTKDIIFIKINNDGYDLGAKRNPIDKNDLPQALETISYYQNLISQNKERENQNKVLEIYNQVSFVSKEKIAQTADYNLSSDRYIETPKLNTDYPMVKLGEVATIGAGNSAPQGNDLFNGTYPFFRTSDVGAIHLSNNLIKCRDYLTEQGVKGLRLFPAKTILFPKSGASILLNHRAMLGIEGYVSSHLATIIAKESYALPSYIYYLLLSIDARDIIVKQNYPSLTLSTIANIEIPLPPLKEQEAIVKEIEEYERIIENLKEKIEDNKKKIQERIRKVWG